MATNHPALNPYDILQVSPAADVLVIRAAYRSLIQRYHPDRNPGDAQAAEQAVLVTQAYELLADPQRRAAHDAQSLAERAALRHAPHRKTLPHSTSRRTSAASASQPGRIVWALWVVAGLVFLFLGWAFKHFLLTGPEKNSPERQLAEVRLQLQSPQTHEAQRRALLARKQAVLEQHEDLRKTENILRAEDAASRSQTLLLEPITVSLILPAGLNASNFQLSIPEITLVLGSFDTVKLHDHLLRHRTRVVQELVRNLAAHAALAVLAPDSEARLKRLVRESVMTSLDIGFDDEYPSTYFESPGRYGVVDVLLPQNFLLLKQPL